MLIVVYCLGLETFVFFLEAEKSLVDSHLHLANHKIFGLLLSLKPELNNVHSG